MPAILRKEMNITYDEFQRNFTEQSTILKNAIREAEESFSQGENFDTKDLGISKKITDYHNSMKSYIQVIGEGIRNMRELISNSYEEIDRLSSIRSLRSTEMWVEFMKEAENDYSTLYEKITVLWMNFAKREEQINLALKFLNKKEFEPFDFTMSDIPKAQKREVKKESQPESRAVSQQIIRAENIEDEKEEFEDSNEKLDENPEEATNGINSALRQLIISNKNIERNKVNNVFTNQSNPLGQDDTIDEFSLVKMLTGNNLLELPKFSGELKEWPAFWELFRPYVHESRLPLIGKFNALSNALTGRAKAQLKRFPANGTGYQLAIEYLLQQYDQPLRIFKNVYDELKTIKTTRENVAEWRDTINQVAALIGQIERMGKNVDDDTYLTEVKYKFSPTILENLARVEFERYEGRITKMRDLLMEIERYIQVREEIEGLIRPSIMSTAFNVREDKGYAKRCIFCEKIGHNSNACRVIINRIDRQKIARDKKLCFNCLRSGHSVRECKARGCITCNGRHNTAFCSRLNNQQRYVRNNGSFRQPYRGRNNFQNYRNNYRSRSRSNQRDSRFNNSSNFRQDSSQNRFRSRSNERRFDQRNQSRSRSRDNYSNQRRYSQSPRRTQQRSGTPNEKRVVFSRQNLVVANSPCNLLISSNNVWNGSNSESIEKSVDILIDSGAQHSFIRRDLADSLNATIIEKSVRMHLIGFGGNKVEILTDRVVVFIQLPDDSFLRIYVYVTDQITEALGSSTHYEEDIQALQELGIETRNRNYSQFDPQIILGLDLYLEVMNTREEPIELPSGATLIFTKLGPIIYENISQESDSVVEYQHAVVEQEPLQKLIDVDSLGISDAQDKSNEQIKEDFLNEATFEDDGRISVKFPWKEGKQEQLNNNKPVAFKRFTHFLESEKNIKRWPEIVKLIEQQEKLGIIEECPKTEINWPSYYIPFQTVLKEDSNTSKIRLVYDASSHQRNEISLNDALYQGPSILPNLLGILMRIRIAPYLLSGDIEKAFLMVALQQSDRNFTRFFWLKNPMDRKLENNLKIMRFSRIPFGINSSPFLLAMSIQFASQNMEISKKLKKELNSTLYVDNLYVRLDNDKDIFKYYQEAKMFFNGVKMNMREFCSNARNELLKIPLNDRANNVKQKILGYHWDTENDILEIRVPKWEQKAQYSRRDIVAFIAGIFDPIGFIAPIMNEAKLIVTELFPEGSSWDSPQSHEVGHEFENFANKVIREKYIFPRYGLIPMNHKGDHYLVIFTDASKKLYSAVAYIIQEMGPNNKNHRMFYFSKQRIAPKKKEQTIPRLELLSIRLGMAMAKYAITEGDLKFKKIWLCSDATIALSWVKNNRKDQIFIQNRTAEIRKNAREIQEQYCPIQLAHVSTEDNPADLSTKGYYTKIELDNTIWYRGPKWLEDDPKNWPINAFTIEKEETEESQQPANDEGQIVGRMLPVRIEKEREIYCPLTNFFAKNDWEFTVKHTAYALLFIKKLLNGLKPVKKGEIMERIPELGQIADKERITGRIMIQAEKIIYRYHQMAYNLQESLPNYKKGTDGLIYLRTRFTKAAPKFAMNQVLLKPKSREGYLITLNLHKKMLHAGISTILAAIYEKYCGVHWRSVIKSILKSCVICRKLNNHPFKYPERPDIPKERITENSYPFQFTGLDYFGPFTIDFGQGDVCKVWICLFSCMTTRAVHLEYVTNLSAHEFIMAFRRFCNRRSIPEKIYSDNATTFKNASKFVRNNVFPEEALGREFMNKRVEWYFNTPAAPWQGGHYERLVGICKKALKHAINGKQMNRSAFETVITEVERTVNCRPLTYVDAPESGGFIIRPIDFLTFRYKEGNYSRCSSDYEKIMKRRNDIDNYLKQFWQIFEKIYLHENEGFNFVRISSKKYTDAYPEIGEVVLVADNNRPRESWKMGRVSELNWSEDGKLRSVKLTVYNPDSRQWIPTTHVIGRTVNHLIPLEIRPIKGRKENSEETSDAERKKERRIMRNKANKQVKDSRGQSPLRKKKIKNDRIIVVPGKKNVDTFEIPKHNYNTRSSARIARVSMIKTINIEKGKKEIELEERKGTNKIWKMLKLSMSILIWVLIFNLVGKVNANVEQELGVTSQRHSSSKLNETSLPMLNQRIVNGTISNRHPGIGKSLKKTQGSQSNPKVTEPKETTTVSTKIETTEPTTTALELTTEQTELEETTTEEVMQVRKITESSEKSNNDTNEEVTPTSDIKGIETTESVNNSERLVLEENLPPEIREQWKQFKKEMKIKLIQRRSRLPKPSNGTNILQRTTTTTQKPKVIIAPKIETTTQSTSITKIECLPNGVRIIDHNYAYKSNYTVCSDEFCISPIEAARETEVTFPLKELLHDHKVRWKRRERTENDKYMVMEKICPARDLCQSIHCTFCFINFVNPHCHPAAFTGLVIIILLIIIIPIIMRCNKFYLKICCRSISHSRFTRVMRFIIVDLWCGLALIWEAIKALGRFCCKKQRRKVKRMNYEIMQGLIDNSKNQSKNDIELKNFRNRKTKGIKSILKKPSKKFRSRSLEKKNMRNDISKRGISLESVRFRSKSPGRTSITSFRRTYWKPLKISNFVLGIVMIFCLIQSAYTCDRIIPITHNESMCENNKCKLVTTQEIEFNRLQKTICISITTPNAVIMKYEVEALYTLLQCKKGNSIWTHNASLHYDYSLRCAGHGKCGDDKCSQVTENTKVAEFAEANNYPGKTHCTEACGSFFCTGCAALWDSSCLFYRTFAKLTSDEFFEVFQCDEWQPSVVIKINSWTIEGNKKIATSEMILAEGDMYEMLNEAKKRVAIVKSNSIDTHNYKIFDTHFLRKENQLAQAENLEDNLPLICDKKSKACRYKEVCKCESAGRKPSCQCSHRDLYQTLTDHESALPVISDSYEIINHTNNLPAIKLIRPKASLQISFDSVYNINTNYNNLDCHISDYTQATGCTNCLKGATFKVDCESKNFTTAIISCGNKTFIDSLNCGPGGVSNLIKRKYDDIHVNDVCTVRCGGKRKIFEVTGTLAYIPPKNLDTIVSYLRTKKQDESSPEEVQMPGFFSHTKVIIENAIFITGAVLIIGILAYVIIRCIIPLAVKAAMR